MRNSESYRSTCALLGRLLVGLAFVVSGSARMQAFYDNGMQFSTVGVLTALMRIATMMADYCGGIMLGLGYQTRIVSSTLILCTILSTLPLQDNADSAELLKIAPAIAMLLLLDAFGAGKFSMDAGRPKHTASKSSPGVGGKHE